MTIPITKRELFILSCVFGQAIDEPLKKGDRVGIFMSGVMVMSENVDVRAFNNGYIGSFELAEDGDQEISP